MRNNLRETIISARVIYRKNSPFVLTRLHKGAGLAYLGHIHSDVSVSIFQRVVDMTETLTETPVTEGNKASAIRSSYIRSTKQYDAVVSSQHRAIEE